MQLSKEEYARKRICNGRSVWIENSVTQDNCLASLGNPHDAEQLLSWQDFQSALHYLTDSYNLFFFFFFS